MTSITTKPDSLQPAAEMAVDLSTTGLIPAQKSIRSRNLFAGNAARPGPVFLPGPDRIATHSLRRFSRSDYRLLAGGGIVSMPSVNFTPVISFGNWLWPLSRRQLFCAASASLKTMASAVLFDRHPFDRICL